MARRLLLSLLMVSAVLATLIVGTFAYFKDSTTGTVSIEAGTTELDIYYMARCTGGWVGPMENLNSSWSHIVPGDEIRDCITIENVGDGALDVYVYNKGFTQTGGNLLGALEFRVKNMSQAPLFCAPINRPKITSTRMEKAVYSKMSLPQVIISGST